MPTSHLTNSYEINRFNLFMGKVKCATCHYLPLFNGASHPKYYKMETEVLGVPQTVTAKQIDFDRGRSEIMPTPELEHSFKTTTVRNTSFSEPYMHNGVFNTLKEVTDFYNEGGGVGEGLKVPNQTLPSDKLNLTDIEKKRTHIFS